MKKALQKDISNIVERLKNKYQPQGIILFGSAVRGELKEGSDIDFLVVKNSRKPAHKRIIDIFRSLRGLDREYPLDFIVLTPGELKERVKLGDFFVKDILAEGKLLYGTK